MSRVRRAGAVGIITCAALPLFPVPAALAEAGVPVPVDVGGWFWADQTSGSVGPAPVGKTVPDGASGVKTLANLAVAYKPTADSPDHPGTADPNKETYVQFDLYAVAPVGSTISKLVITLPLSPDEEQLNLETAKTSLIACQPDISVGPAEGESFASKPGDDCTKAAAGVYDAGKHGFSFDVTALAQTWLDGTTPGIGIRNKLDQVQPFQIVFKDYSFATATVDFTPPVEEIPDPEPTPLPEPPPFNSGGLPPVTTPPVNTPPVVPQPVPAPQPAPQTAPPTRNVVAQPPFTPDSSLPPGLWLGLVGLVGLLGTVSLLLGGGPRSAPAPVTPRRLDLRTRSAAPGRAPAFGPPRTV